MAQEDQQNLNDLQYRYGLLKLAKGEMIASSKILKDAVEIANPDNILYLALADQVLTALGKHTEAQHVWDLAIQRDSKNISIISQYLWRSANAERYQQGQVVIDQLVADMEKEPKDFNPQLYFLQIDHALLYADHEMLVQYLANAKQKILKYLPSDKIVRHKIFIYIGYHMDHMINFYPLVDEQREFLMKQVVMYGKELKDIQYSERDNVKKETIKQIESLYQRRAYYLSTSSIIEDWLNETESWLSPKMPDLTTINADQNFLKNQLQSGDVLLGKVRAKVKMTDGYQQYSRILHAMANLQTHNNNMSGAMALLNEFLAHKKPIPPQEINLYLKVFSANNNLTAVEKIYRYAISINPDNEQWPVDLMNFYMQQGKMGKAGEVIQQAYKHNPYSIALAQATLEVHIYKGEITALLKNADKILHDENLSLTSEDKSVIYNMVITTLEHPLYADQWQDEAQNYRNQMQNDVGAEADDSPVANIRTRTQELIEKPWLPVDHTLRNTALTIAIPAGLFAAWTIVKPRYKKQQEAKKQRKAILDYKNMLAQAQTAAESRKASSSAKSSGGQTTQKAVGGSSSERQVTLAEMFALEKQYSKPYKPVKGKKVKQPLPEANTTTIPEPEVENEPAVPFTCTWADRAVPDYNEENAQFFVQVQAQDGRAPVIPTFFTLTPEAFNAIGADKYAERLEEKLVEKPEIGGKNCLLVWRTYEVETPKKKLEYKVRLRLTSDGIFGRCVNAYDDQQQIIAQVWVFDKVRDHDQETKDLKNGIGVGKLIDKPPKLTPPKQTERPAFNN